MKLHDRLARWSLAACACALGTGALVTGALVIAACEPSESSAGSEPAPSARAEPAPALTPAPVCTQDGPRYLAFLGSGTCRDVPSARSEGTWVAHSLFPEAPEALRSSACAYQWTAPASSALADIEALSALDTEHLTRAHAFTTTCEAAVLAPGSATLIPPQDGAVSAPTGVSGCDVCAQVFGRMLFVILPADKLDLRTVMVTTTGGKSISFDVNIPPGTQAFSVELPSAAQDSYKEGRVPLTRDSF